MSQTKSYEMKDSCVEWIGDIPCEWSTANIGSLYTQRNEKVSDKDYAPLSVTKQGVLPQLETVAKTDNGDNRKLVRTGDFAINSRSDRRGSCGISQLDGSVSLINTVLKPRDKMHPVYYNWLFHTEQFADEFYKWGYGIVDDLWSTHWSEMKKIMVIYPPLAEQEAIASYLDEKCGAIDSLIAEAKETIEEYKAWKASVIFEAVTKGLDPNADMKDSGVAWIGNIPKGWRISKLKYLLSSPLQYGANSSGVEFDQNKPRYIRITDITNDNHLCEENLLSLDIEEARDYILKDNDILLARSGATAGKSFLYKSQYGRAAFAGYLIRASLDTMIANPKFVYYTTLGAGYEQWKDSIAIQATISNIGANRYNNYFLPVPPLAEQEAIADYLDKHCSAIDGIIAEKQSLIDELETYKKSLIYETVTGKRRVC